MLTIICMWIRVVFRPPVHSTTISWWSGTPGNTLDSEKRKLTCDSDLCPKCDWQWHCAGGKNWTWNKTNSKISVTSFSVLDQGKMFHQSFMTPESRPLTAFSTPYTNKWIGYMDIRLYDIFRFMNAPATFLKLMDGCLERLQDDICVPYLDDILVFTKSFDEQFEPIKTILQSHLPETFNQSDLQF